MKLKAGGITNLTDARYFSAKGVDWMGFEVDAKNEKQISEIYAISQWVEGPEFVAEVRSESAAEIDHTLKLLEMSRVQIPYPSNMNLLNELGAEQIFVSVALSENQSDWLERGDLTELLDRGADVIISLKTDDIECLQSVLDVMARENAAKREGRIFLDASADLDRLNLVLNTNKLAHLNISGGEEEKVGFKSFDEWDDFFDLIWDRN